jgi:phage-related protein
MAILGLNEFEQAIKLMHEKRFQESENYLKEALKILKQAGQDRTMSYIYVLKRLAYVCFLDRRY